MAGIQALSSQSLANESVAHEDHLYPISTLTHSPQVTIAAVGLPFPCLCPALLSPMPFQTRHTVHCFVFRWWTRFVVLYVFVLHPPCEMDCSQILHSVNFVSSPTTKCSQIGDLFLGLVLAVSARASSAQFARNAHAHNQYMFIARQITDSNTVKLLNISR